MTGPSLSTPHAYCVASDEEGLRPADSEPRWSASQGTARPTPIQEFSDGSASLAATTLAISAESRNGAGNCGRRAYGAV